MQTAASRVVNNRISMVNRLSVQSSKTPLAEKNTTGAGFIGWDAGQTAGSDTITECSLQGYENTCLATKIKRVDRYSMFPGWRFLEPIPFEGMTCKSEILTE